MEEDDALFLSMCLDQIVLGNIARPIVIDKDQDKFDERNHEAVMFLKLLVIDEMLPKVTLARLLKRFGLT